MNKYLILASIFCCLLSACDDDEWPNGDPELEHVYFFGFEEWSAKFNNTITYTISQGETATIPVKFFSERVCKDDVVVKWFVKSDLVLNTDYEIVDKDGKTITPADGKSQEMVWPKATKGVQNIYIKAKNGNTGSISVLTFDPDSEEPISYENTTIAKTGSYEVRAFTQNYKVTVKIK